MDIKKIRERSIIIIPPFLLLLVGIGVYITVIKMTTPDEKIVSVSTAAMTTPVPTSTPNTLTDQPAIPNIQLDIPGPDLEQIAKWQTEVSEGRELWRKNPLEVAEATAGQYGFLVDDQLTLVVDNTSQPPSGQVIVLAKSAGKNYQIILSQPGTKGDDGVWVITDINETN